MRPGRIIHPALAEAIARLQPELGADTRFHLRHETFNLDAEPQILDWLAEGARTRGACDFYLEVRPSNAAALRLYARSGFVEIGRRRGYYPAADGREDAIVMRRTL